MRPTSLHIIVVLAFFVFTGCEQMQEEELSMEASSQVAAPAQDRVASSADKAVPLMAGMNAPAFSLPTADGSTFSFDPENIERPVVLTFYRGGWCPYCNRQLEGMRHAEDSLVKMGYDVVFASMDRAEILRSNLKIKNVKYTLLSDNEATLTKDFGLAYRVDDKTVARYLKMGIDLEGDSGEKHHILPVPATYIIGKDDVIDFVYANPDYSVRVNPELVVKAAELALEDE